MPDSKTIRLRGWLKSWFPCPEEWMDDHGWSICWTCFYRHKRWVKKQAKEPRIPPARVLK